MIENSIKFWIIYLGSYVELLFMEQVKMAILVYEFDRNIVILSNRICYSHSYRGLGKIKLVVCVFHGVL